MSFDPLAPKNIVADGPDVFEYMIAEAQNAFDNLDASPIYTSIGGQVSINGSYESGGCERSYNATLTAETLTRIGLRDPIISHFVLEAGREMNRGNLEPAYLDLAAIDSIPSGRFIATIGMSSSGESFAPYPFDPPLLSPMPSKVDSEAGVRDCDGETTDLRAEATWQAPFFRGSISGGDLELVIRLRVLMDANLGAYLVTLEEVINASEWTSADFRDIRGTYGGNGSDENGINYNWSFTIS